jgi:hypothetical protein
MVELDEAASESEEEESGSDAVIDDDELEADLTKYVVLATCLHNDRSMHMIDPRLAAAAQEDMFAAGGGDAVGPADDEGDEPPYDLVPVKTVRPFFLRHALRISRYSIENGLFGGQGACWGRVSVL